MKFSVEQKRILKLAKKEQNTAYASELYYQLLAGPKERWAERVWREIHR